MFCKGFIINFAKFIGKHLYRGRFIKKRFRQRYFPVSLAKIFRTPFSKTFFLFLQTFFLFSFFFSENLFSKCQCGFRKGILAQHCLMKLIEKWRECIDKGLEFGALLTDLPKAFDCLPHDLIAKLNAYRADISALRLIFVCLTNRKQRTKIGNDYSSSREILYGVPQASRLEPLLFNIFICDLFLITDDSEMAYHADDTTP